MKLTRDEIAILQDALGDWNDCNAADYKDGEINTAQLHNRHTSFRQLLHKLSKEEPTQ